MHVCVSVCVYKYMQFSRFTSRKQGMRSRMNGTLARLRLFHWLDTFRCQCSRSYCCSGRRPVCHGLHTSAGCNRQKVGEWKRMKYISSINQQKLTRTHTVGRGVLERRKWNVFLLYYLETCLKGKKWKGGKLKALGAQDFSPPTVVRLTSFQLPPDESMGPFWPSTIDFLLPRSPGR